LQWLYPDRKHRAILLRSNRINTLKDNSPSQKQYDSFTLTAAGEAVDVSFAIQGNVDGKLKTVFQLNTQGGYATIENFEAISAVKGPGIIKQEQLLHLNLMMSVKYCGARSTVWILRGTKDTLAGSLCPFFYKRHE
jgi:hypothetical protein